MHKNTHRNAYLDPISVPPQGNLKGIIWGLDGVSRRAMLVPMGVLHSITNDHQWQDWCELNELQLGLLLLMHTKAPHYISLLHKRGML